MKKTNLFTYLCFCVSFSNYSLATDINFFESNTNLDMLRKLMVCVVDSNHIEYDGCFNYSNARISDVSSHSVTPLQNVLEDIKNEVKKYTQPKALKILLRDNYITDNGVEFICNFVLENENIKENIVYLDLSNNRISAKVVPLLEKLLGETKNLEANLSINYLVYDDIKNLPQNILSRITCRSH